MTQTNGNQYFYGKRNSVRRKICNWVGGHPPVSNLCDVAKQGLKCNTEDFSDLVRCCYRRNNGFICTNSDPTDTSNPDKCGIDCDNTDIDWSICDGLTNQKMLDYLKLKTNKCNLTCSKNNQIKSLICCNDALCGPSLCEFRGDCTGPSDGSLSTGIIPANDLVNCTSLGTVPPESPPPPGSPSFTGLWIDYGTCLTFADGHKECDFTHAVDACKPQCLAIRDVCRKYECERAGIYPCPGIWLMSQGCGCPNPGFAYSGCPGSNTIPGTNPPPSPFAPITTMDSNIILVKVSLNNQDTCIPVLCEDNCDGYDLCE
jgi:hypothetical protein